MRRPFIPNKGRRPKGLRYLICEDEPNLGHLIRDFLEDNGQTATLTYTGTQALEALTKQKFDRVILSNLLVGLSGYDVLETIRQRPQFETLPVMMISASNRDQDVRLGYKLGADIYLTKPLNPIELLI